MIYDTLNNLPNYLGMSENLDAVIEFVMARDINNLPAGKTRILGDKAVVTVSTDNYICLNAMLMQPLYLWVNRCCTNTTGNE